MRKPGQDPKASAPQPFLTEAQRSALDAALLAKQQEHAKAAKARPAGEAGHDKKSRNTKGTGAAKKSGGGGKFTWGSALTDNYAAAALDSHDPNYDSDEDKVVVYESKHDQYKAEVQAFKQQLFSIVEEYFSSADVANVAAELDDLDASTQMFYFVKTLIRVALDRQDREREMASSLISQLYGETITSSQMQKGFSSLVEGLDDIALDVPAAPELLALFVARAVVDDILPPSFVDRLPVVEGSSVADLKHRIEMQLSARHSAERMQRCWGTDTKASYQDMKEAITKLLEEFVASHDAEEAGRRLHALGTPFFHHEVVKQIVHLAMNTPTQAPHLIDLLSKLVTTGEISQAQLEAGFGRVRDNLDDTALDVPSAPNAFQEVLTLARDANIIDMPFEAEATNGAPAPEGVHSVAAFKMAAVTAVREYFNSQDVEEIRRWLEDVGQPGLHHILVKHSVLLALDHKDRERELVSVLLSDLVPNAITAEQVAGGFTRLLAGADDTVLDIPDAAHLLEMFLGRAIVDEVLPPSFLTAVLPSLEPNTLGVAVVQNAGLLLGSRHGSERLQNCWHGGGLNLEQVQGRIKTALLEYCYSKDADEAAKCLTELGVPHYHHEVVKTIVELSFEDATRQPALTTLLDRLAATGEVSMTQMLQGFERIRRSLDDYVLDYPTAKKQFQELQQHGVSKGWLQEGEPGSNGAAAAAPAPAAST